MPPCWAGAPTWCGRCRRPLRCSPRSGCRSICAVSPSRTSRPPRRCMTACRSCWCKERFPTSPGSRATWRASDSPCATAPAARSTPGPRCPRVRSLRPAIRCRSRPVLRRRRRKGRKWSCASSIVMMPSPACIEGPVARILLAEDEEALRAFVARALAQDGHEVVATADGGEALDALSREQGKFDLLLTDIRMPVMDGIALALAAARDYPELMILLMTGYADQRERAHGLDALIHDVITKPFSLADIRKAVAEALVARGR